MKHLDINFLFNTIGLFNGSSDLDAFSLLKKCNLVCLLEFYNNIDENVADSIFNYPLTYFTYGGLRLKTMFMKKTVFRGFFQFVFKSCNLFDN